jgi:hypothetical protein
MLPFTLQFLIAMIACQDAGHADRGWPASPMWLFVTATEQIAPPSFAKQSCPGHHALR